MFTCQYFYKFLFKIRENNIYSILLIEFLLLLIDIIPLNLLYKIKGAPTFIGTPKDKKAFMKDLKEVYKATTEELALAQLDKLKELWGSTYGMVIDSWYNNWNNLSTFFEFSPRIRKIIYTTNALEGFNRQVRKYTKTRTIFPTDESLNKCVYLATMEIMEKWTQPIPNWGATLAELTLFFSEELNDELA